MKVLQQSSAYAAVLLAICLVTACATNGGTSILQSADAETLPHSTYSWANDSFVQDPPRGFSASRLNALEEAINSALSQKGYSYVEPGETAGLIVTVDVVYDISGSGGLTPPTYEIDERRQAREEDGVSTVRVVRVDHPVETSVAQTNRNNRAATALRAGVTPHDANAEVGGVIFIGVLDAAQADQLWQGQVTKRIRLFDPESFEREIGEDVSRLFHTFPISEPE